MTTNELFDLSACEKDLLKEDERTRVDDYYLIYKVCLKKNPRLENMSFGYVMKNSSVLGLPISDSITRIRRDIQKANPELAKESVVENRQAEEKVHREYFSCRRVYET